MKRPNRENAASSALLSRRALLLGSAQLGFIGVLGARMQAMQVEQAEDYRLLAEENRVNISLSPPARGAIFDRNGVPLAENEQNYRIVIVRDRAGDVDEVLDRLVQLVPIPEEKIAEAKEQIAKGKAFIPVTIADRVPWQHIAKITANAPALPGVSAEVGLSRTYPLGPMTAHVVGYVGPVSSYDLSKGYLATDPDPLLQIDRFPVGKTGVEAQQESRLRGTAGTIRSEVNAIGRVMRELSHEEGQSGADMQLTMDSDLQAYVHARLADISASAVVMDVENGDLHAIASTPSFDPNLFVRGISTDDYNTLLENDIPTRERLRPLASKAVQDTYPPGSTFKMVTALAALEAGVIGPEETVYCPGHMDVAGTRFHCWKRVGHGNINLHESLKQSCDVYYYEVAQRVGIDKMAEMARRLGIGVRHNIPMSAVAPGVAPDKAWKAEALNEDWRIGDTVNASIGQGYVLASPLHLAVMTARIATGREVEPRLIDRVDGVRVPIEGGGSLGINENILRRVRSSMFDVSNHKRGTAYRSRIADDEMKMAGKTGTSQVRRITAEERARGVIRNEQLPWHRRDHALFVGFAPYDDPRFAVSVIVQHGGGGSRAAAPIARDVMLQALYGGMPPLEAYPTWAQEEIAVQQDRIKEVLRTQRNWGSRV